MIEICFKNDNRVSIIVDKVKYIYNDDLKQYWTIKKTIDNFVNKTLPSEYAKENNIDTSFIIDGEIATKHDEMFIVSDAYNIDDDIKLGSKSLILRYITGKINSTEYRDDLCQLNGFLNYLASNLSDDIFVISAIESLNKIIPKIITASYLKDDEYANSDDLDYDELICIQLKMISGSLDTGKRTLIFAFIPFLTKRIKNTIDEMQGCYIVVLFNYVSNNIIFDDNLVIDTIDLEDEERLYERMMSMSEYYDIKDYKNKIKNEFLNKLFK